MMNKTNIEPGYEFSTALFISHAPSAKLISSALREAHLFSQYFSNLREFWSGIQLNVPHLVFIDIADCTNQEAPFYKHPLVVKGQLKFVLIYREETSFLLNKATWAKNAFGVINLNQTLNIQMSLILERRKKELELENHLNQVEDRFIKLQNKSIKFMEERSKADFFQKSFITSKEISQDIELYAQGGDYISAITRRLSEWNKINQMGLYVLSQNGQRLLSPQNVRNKYLVLPGLYLGNECKEGILPFAREMAFQVVHEIFEHEPIEIKIAGAFENPDIILYLDVETEFKNEFRWDLLEQDLQFIYRKVQLLKKENPQKTFLIDSAEGLDRMDEIYFHQTESNERVFYLSFTPMISYIKNKNKSKFYYTQFYQSFLMALKSALHETSTVSQMGPWSILIFAKQSMVDQEFKAMQMMIKTFSYWKFFEEENKIIFDEIHPQLTLITPSSCQFFKLFYREVENMDEEYISTTTTKNAPSTRFQI